eukprot:gene9337-biopygen4695
MLVFFCNTDRITSAICVASEAASHVAWHMAWGIPFGQIHMVLRMGICPGLGFQALTPLHSTHTGGRPAPAAEAQPRLVELVEGGGQSLTKCPSVTGQAESAKETWVASLLTTRFKSGGGMRCGGYDPTDDTSVSQPWKGNIEQGQVRSKVVVFSLASCARVCACTHAREASQPRCAARSQPADTRLDR